MKRVLCIRFPNWPIQCLRRRLRITGNMNSAVSLHTAPPMATGEGNRKAALDEDTRYVRGLFPSAAGGPAIVAVSTDAWTRGVRPGMPLAEARSMAQPMSVPVAKRSQSKGLATPALPPIEFHEWNPFSDRAELIATAELTRRYAPVVGLDDVPMPDSLLLDITGCGPLFGGEAALAEMLLKDLRNGGLSCRIAIAQTVSVVWALTHTDLPRRLEVQQSSADRRRFHRTLAESMQHELPIQIVPQGQHRNEVNPLPVAVSRLSLSDLEILKHLGIRTIGQLLGLPREDLPSRLSPRAVLRIQQLQDVVDEPIEPLPEANPVAANWSSEEPAVGVNDHRHVLQHLTERIAEQLTRRRMACSSVTCQFRCVDGVIVLLTASVVKPTQSAELLYEVLCLRLETELTLASMEESLAASRPSMPPASSNDSTNASVTGAKANGPLSLLASQPVSSVSVLATVAPIPAARQRDLFSASEHIVPQEELATLITRLSGRLGSKAVLTVNTQADPRPEFSILAEPVLSAEPTAPRQNQVDATLQRLTEPSPSGPEKLFEVLPRPIRLLATPQRLPADDANSRRRFPSQVMIAGQTFQLVKFSSPERLQTAWWTDQPCHRDYFQVMTNSESRLWMFRDLADGAWFLHGIFD